MSNVKDSQDSIGNQINKICEYLEEDQRNEMRECLEQCIAAFERFGELTKRFKELKNE